MQSVATMTSSPAPPVFAPFEDTCMNLLREFPGFTRTLHWTIPVQHVIRHQIITTGQPVRCHPRRLVPEKYCATTI